MRGYHVDRRSPEKSQTLSRTARRNFQNPEKGDEDLVKIPDQRQELCKYFYNFGLHKKKVL